MSEERLYERTIPMFGENSFFELLNNNDLIAKDSLRLRVNQVSTNSGKLPYGVLIVDYQQKGKEDSHVTINSTIGKIVFPNVNSDSFDYDQKVKKVKSLIRDDVDEQKSLMTLMLLNDEKVKPYIEINQNNVNYFLNLSDVDNKNLNKDKNRLKELTTKRESITMEELNRNYGQRVPDIQKNILRAYDTQYNYFDISGLSYQLMESQKPFTVLENSETPEDIVNNLSSIKLLSEDEAKNYDGNGEVVNLSKFLKNPDYKQKEENDQSLSKKVKLS